MTSYRGRIIDSQYAQLSGKWPPGSTGGNHTTSSAKSTKRMVRRYGVRHSMSLELKPWVRLWIRKRARQLGSLGVDDSAAQLNSPWASPAHK